MLAAGLLAAGLLAAGPGCGAPDPGERPEDAAAGSAADTAAASAARDTGASAAAKGTGGDVDETNDTSGPAEDAAGASDARPALPLPGPEVEPELPLRRYRLLLVNRAGVEAVVYASAGAGRVLLDTLAGRDSSRIDVEVRAERLRLEALDLGDETLADAEVRLDPDSLTRWEVPPRR